MTEAEKIAAGLTKAQREALQWLADGHVAQINWRYRPEEREQPRTNTLLKLMRLGLADGKQAVCCDEVCVTPLGLEVRAILKRNDHEQ